MFRAIYSLAAALIIALSAGVLWAQDTEKPYFEALLEDVLSSPQMQVKVRGLTGTFSSAATVDELIFSDPLGEWMRIEGAQIVWARSALLKKRIEVQTLRAKSINLVRIPKGEEAETKAEARVFRVPQLPVAINIENLSAETVVLAAPVLGRAAALRVDGQIKLAAGAMDVAFNADHLDGSGGLVLEASYDPAAENLAVDLVAKEDADGLIVNLLGIPKRPSAKFTLKGSGPQTAFAADLALVTDGADRLTGWVIAAPLAPVGSPAAGAKFVVDVSGDLQPLFDTPYQRFFGNKAQLRASIERRNTGALRISDMEIETAAFQVGGLVVLSPDATPLRIDIDADIRDPTGAPILLPVTGPELRLESAKLVLDYTEGDPWTGQIDILGFDRDGLRADLIQLRGGGAIAPAFLTKSPSDMLLSADLELQAKGLDADNAKLRQAMGPELSASGRLELVKDQPFRISNLIASNTNIEASLDGDVSGLADALAATGVVRAKVRNLAPLSGILGQRLQGQADITADGTVAILSGAFDLEISARAAGLALSNAQIDPLIKGANSLTVSAKRTVDGLFLEGLSLTNPQVSANIESTVKAGRILADVSGQLNNAAILSDALSGSLKVSGAIGQNGTDFDVDAAVTGIGGLAADVEGQIPIGAGAWNLAMTGRAPLALLDKTTKSDAVKARGVAVFDLALRGPPTLEALTGQITTQGATVILPKQQLTIEALRSRLNLRAGQVIVDADASVTTGGRLRAQGTIELNAARAFPSDLTVQLRDFLQRDRTFYSTRLNGDLTVKGPLVNGAEIGGAISMWQTEINLAGTTQPRLSFLPQIEHRFEPAGVKLTRQSAGLLSANVQTKQSASRPYRLNLLIEAPSRVFIRGRGVDAEFGGRIRVTGTTAQVVPTGSFNLIRGRMDLLGKRLSLTEGGLTMIGSLDPSVRLVATTTSGEYDTSIVISGLVSDPQITLISTPALPEDEILARMFFSRGLDQISPFQALQIAAALRELSGKTTLKFVSTVRDKLDLDDFNIQVDEDGNAGVRAGKYISDDVYTDVTIAGDNKSEISINLDLNKNVTVRGSLSEDGNSSVGVFFEKDY